MTQLKNGRMITTSCPVGPMHVARDGSIWIGQVGVLTHFKEGKVTRYDTTRGLPNKWVSAITEDDQGMIIWMDAVGVRRFKDGVVQPYLLKDGQPYTSTEFVASAGLFLRLEGKAPRQAYRLLDHYAKG